MGRRDLRTNLARPTSRLCVIQDLGRAIRRLEQNSAGNCTEPSIFSNDLSVEEPFDRRVRQNRIVAGNHVVRIREMHGSPLSRQSRFACSSIG